MKAQHFLSICLVLICGSASATFRYVDINCTNPVAPYTGWETAATNIQSAVDEAADGDTVFVADGHYLLSDQITVTNAITIQSVSGPETSIVDGGGTHRCFYLTVSCEIRGFSIINGYSSENGGGLYCSGNVQLITNCVVSGNHAVGSGGGMYRGTAIDCTISNNTAYDGGGAYQSTVESCTISDNVAAQGGGMRSGIANHCVISANRATGGGGGTLSSTLNNSTISGNTATWGGGIDYGTANNCMIYGNTANTGGGCDGVTANNCAIYDNVAYEDGGGLYDGSARNCTIIGNIASGKGGGVSGSPGGDIPRRINIYNSIVRENRAPLGSDLNLARTYNTCSPDVIHGVDGNITNAPMLVSASHLAADSPCRGAGSTEYTAGTDIDGEPWLDPPSMGCDEFHGSVGGPLQVKIECSVTNPVSGYPVRLFAHIDGAVSMHVWSFGDGVKVTNRFNPIHVWKDPGTYDVVLTTYNDDYPGGISATQTVYVDDRETTTMYVSKSGNDANDGSSWTMAKATIQAGVDAQDHPGGVVLVGSGTYALTNEIMVDKRVVIESADGPGSTIVDGQGVTCCFHLGKAECVISGFAVTHGIAIAYEDSHGSTYSEGGGFKCESIDPVVTNCWIMGNAAENYYSYGGGIYGGTAKDCLIADNAANRGGGAYGTIAEDCTIRANTANGGGGMYGGRAMNCRIVQNDAKMDGGGMMASEAYSCLVMQNHALEWGGGGYNTKFYNCNIIYNTADDIYGGVAAFSQVSDVFSIVRNCIVWHNSAPRIPNVNPDSYYISVSYSCSPQLIHGVDGNITNVPLLITSTHVAVDSPCRGAGSILYVSGTDIDGEPWLDPPSMGCDEYSGSATGPLQVEIESLVPNAVVGFALPFTGMVEGQVTSTIWSFGDGISEENVLLPKHAWEIPGTYDVVLTAYNDEYPRGVSATQTVHVADPYVATVYVSPSGDDSNDGSGWAMAKATIQAGVDAQFYGGGLVLVTNGIYSLTNEIVVSKPVTVHSVNGPEVTIVAGQGTTRCFNLGGAECKVYGFTVANGYAIDGGGIYCHNTTPQVSHCIIRDNVASDGGGIYRGTVDQCIISRNSARYDGGGLRDSAVNNSVIVDNTGMWSGGGMHGGVASNCIIIGNKAPGSSLAIGGGLYNSSAYNCTIIQNSADRYGGGIAHGRAYNCIIWHNTAPSNPNIYDTDEVRYTCSPEVVDGVDGNITETPAFLDFDGGDFRLLATSPCIDAGLNDIVAGSLDLDGMPRIVDGDFDGIATVDMGAYEYQVMTMPSSAIHMPSINLKSNGRCPVKILGSESFDVADLDPSSIRFADASPVKYKLGDQNGDGLPDLMLHFMTSELEIEPGDTTAMLIGQTHDGTLVVATPAIKVVPNKKR